MPVLIGWIRGDDIENHGEHNDENEEEKHKNFEICHNTNDHSDNVAETFDDTHKEEGLEQADHSDNDHGNL